MSRPSKVADPVRLHVDITINGCRSTVEVVLRVEVRSVTRSRVRYVVHGGWVWPYVDAGTWREACRQALGVVELVPVGGKGHVLWDQPRAVYDARRLLTGAADAGG